MLRGTATMNERPQIRLSNLFWAITWVAVWFGAWRVPWPSDDADYYLAISGPDPSLFARLYLLIVPPCAAFCALLGQMRFGVYYGALVATVIGIILSLTLPGVR
jgi:hypothetical protein